MTMSFKKLSILLLGLLPLFFCGCDDDDSVGTDNAPKPEMSLAVSPQTGLHYGDKVSITGTLTDEKNLQMYTILLKDANETELYRKEQMLLGQSFQMSEQFSIPTCLRMRQWETSKSKWCWRTAAREKPSRALT